MGSLRDDLPDYQHFNTQYGKPALRFEIAEPFPADAEKNFFWSIGLSFSLVTDFHVTIGGENLRRYDGGHSLRAAIMPDAAFGSDRKDAIV